MSKIGLVIPYWSDINKSELIEVARLAEELGFHSLWIPEMWGRDSFSLFDDFKRSTAFYKLAAWQRHGIVSESDLALFTEETQATVKAINQNAR